MHEIDEKVDRLARLATRRGLGGILLNTQPNFAWLTGGRSNQIDGSRENGAGSLLVSARGERFAVANNIEMPRLQDEALAGLGFTPCEYPWTREHADPGTPIATAASAAGGRIGCDAALPGGMPIEADIAAARVPLTAAEVERYRALGGDLGRIIGELCRGLVPGQTEIDIAHRVAASVACIGARAHVTLVAADDRMARFRHPVPTDAAWRRQVMVVVCAQRQGLVAALSRIVSAGRAPDQLESRTARGGQRVRATRRRDDTRHDRRGVVRGGGARLHRGRISGRRTAPSPGRGHRVPIARVAGAPALQRNRAQRVRRSRGTRASPGRRSKRPRSCLKTASKC